MCKLPRLRIIPVNLSSIFYTLGERKRKINNPLKNWLVEQKRILFVLFYRSTAVINFEVNDV